MKASLPPKKRLKIIILCQNQFGDHIDTYFYCKYLSMNHDVTYMGWNYNLPLQKLAGVKIIHVSRKANIFFRNLRYIRTALTYLRNKPVDVCFIKYFRGCSILRLCCPRTKFVFDIRTASVKPFLLGRLIYDGCLRFESLFFPHITVISRPLANQLGLWKKAAVLPLGSIPISHKPKRFNKLRLLYVGSLSNRKIHRTVEGAALFLKNYPNEHFSYTIIGDGGGEIERLKALIDRRGLKEYIQLLGRIPFTELAPYFDTHNIGVSFVPITSAFNRQPVTKTFDYILSGLVVLGTDTYENRRVITADNGVLIQDSSEAFASGIVKLLKNRHHFQSRIIMKNARIYHWKKIVKDLEDRLMNIANSK